MASYDYASKGLANGIGIPALVLGSLGFLQSSANNGGGVLGGLFGGGNNQLTAAMAENAQLKSTIDSYKSTADVYAALRNENQALSERLLDKYISPMAQEIADNRVSMARQEEQIKCLNEKAKLREEILEGKIEKVGLLANNGITALQGQINCLAQTVNSVTKVVVPNASVCPGWGDVSVTIPTTTTTA